jgi:hypothetical protein
MWVIEKFKELFTSINIFTGINHDLGQGGGLAQVKGLGTGINHELGQGGGLAQVKGLGTGINHDLGQGSKG